MLQLQKNDIIPYEVDNAFYTDLQWLRFGEVAYADRYYPAPLLVDWKAITDEKVDTDRVDRVLFEHPGYVKAVFDNVRKIIESDLSDALKRVILADYQDNLGQFLTSGAVTAKEGESASELAFRINQHMLKTYGMFPGLFFSLMANSPLLQGAMLE